MSIADELGRLQQMHDSGSLSDEEFAQAKKLLLSSGPSSPTFTPNDRNTASLSVDPVEALSSPRLRVLQILAGALLTGLLALLAIFVFLVEVGNPGRGAPLQSPVLSLIALAMLATCGTAALIVPRAITLSGLRRISAGSWRPPGGVDPAAFATAGAKLLAVRQQTMIVELALIQGAGFLGCIAYLIERQHRPLSVVAVVVVWMLLRFPTKARVRAWLERQADILAEMRQQNEMAASASPLE